MSGGKKEERIKPLRRTSVSMVVNPIVCLFMSCCYLNETTRSRNGVLSGFYNVSCFHWAWAIFAMICTLVGCMATLNKLIPNNY